MPHATSPLPLALCITELNVGGAERCLTELATRIDRGRFTPVVYALAARATGANPPLISQLESAGVETHFLGGRGIADLPLVIYRLTRLLKRQRPAVLQSFLFHANVVSRWAAWRAGVPHVLSGVRVAERGAAWHLWLDRATRGLVERYVCVSQDVADFTRVHLRLPKERVAVIPNGIDWSRFADAAPLNLAELGLPPGRRWITYVGRLEPQKGVVELVEHSREWLDRLPEHDLLIVGAGPLLAELRMAAARLGVGSRMHFVGFRGDVAEIMQASELVVLPSYWEGMPNVILEAMAAGKAVVATAVEGVSELLGDVAAAQTAPPADYSALAARMVELANDGAARARLAAANQSRAKGFAWDVMVAAYERLFMEVAGSRR